MYYKYYILFKISVVETPSINLSIRQKQCWFNLICDIRWHFAEWISLKYYAYSCLKVKV